MFTFAIKVASSMFLAFKIHTRRQGSVHFGLVVVELVVNAEE